MSFFGKPKPEPEWYVEMVQTAESVWRWTLIGPRNDVCAVGDAIDKYAALHKAREAKARTLEAYKRQNERLRFEI